MVPCSPTGWGGFCQPRGPVLTGGAGIRRRCPPRTPAFPGLFLRQPQRALGPPRPRPQAGAVRTGGATRGRRDGRRKAGARPGCRVPGQPSPALLCSDQPSPALPGTAPRPRSRRPPRCLTRSRPLAQRELPRAPRRLMKGKAAPADAGSSPAACCC